MDRRTVVTVALALLLVGSGVGAAAEFPGLQTGDVESDTVVLEAAIESDGDARWTIEYRVALDDENTTEAFESLQRDIEQNTSDYRSQFASRMRSTVSTAENATGREMAVENVSVGTSTSLSGEYGVVRYGFDWVGFADVSDDRLATGEVLAGLFLDANTELTISWPEGYVVSLVEPEPDREGERSVTWTGPREFDVGQPRVVLRTRNSAPPWGPLVGIALFGGAGVLWYYRRRQAGRTPVPGVGDDEPAVGAEPDRGAEDDREPEQVSGVEDGTAPGPETGSAASVADAGNEDDTPEELLSPEERVLRLLEANGGRMKQKTITEELDWSAARTSQVVGDLRDDGKVESFRLGRENVLKFPDDEE
ncbi:DUF7345 domain-containing protein [Halolamina sp. C58]|uniref:DUF7345 domain-containing protein n=1 Tax=Halolamina sp. C58 TaxID=3421640 RepID=UPI003EC0C944